jgi:hypothetical protein
MLISGRKGTYLSCEAVYFSRGKDGKLGEIDPDFISLLEQRGGGIFTPLSRGAFMLAPGKAEVLLSFEIVQGRIVMLPFSGVGTLCTEQPTLFTKEVLLVDWEEISREIARGLPC